MKQTISAWTIWVLAVLATCGSSPPAYAQLRLSGVALHASTAESPASTQRLAPVVAILREQQTIWLNAMLWTARANFAEDAVCLRLQRRLPPDGWVVDSLVSPTFNRASTWKSAWFDCPDGTAPLHMHVITSADTAWLRSRGDTTQLTWRKRCEPSDLDVSPHWSKYPFVALMCGQGLDSIVAFRVLP